ncbi:MAG TPA: hypothetical protein PKD61_06590 [Polyangiaceae bacterium]|nr:hypothetical protein [Polyangiaceae bacterium]
MMTGSLFMSGHDPKQDDPKTVAVPAYGSHAPNAPRPRQVTERMPSKAGNRAQLPVDPNHMLTAFAPPAAELVELSVRDPAPESEAAVSSLHPAAQAFAELPPDAPEWMRAARVMADALEACLARRSVDYLEQAAIERAWYAWTLGGATPKQVLRVAHIVRRAYEALGRSNRADHEDTIRSCGEVLHASLPSSVRETVPLERAVWVVRQMREQSDPWLAMVEGTADLLGWKDFARVHAAYVIREVIKQA